MTETATNDIATSIALREPNRLSHYQFTMKRQNEEFIVADLLRDEPDATASRRTLTLLRGDITRAIAATSASSVNASVFRAMDLVGGHVDLVTGHVCVGMLNANWAYVDRVAEVIIQHADGTVTHFHCND
jgi:hypothetical protein